MFAQRDITPVEVAVERAALTRLNRAGDGHAIVSRQESIDAVGGEALAGFAQVFILAPHAWQELAGDEADTAVARSVSFHRAQALIRVPSNVTFVLKPGKSIAQSYLDLRSNSLEAEEPTYLGQFVGGAGVRILQEPVYGFEQLLGRLSQNPVVGCCGY